MKQSIFSIIILSLIFGNVLDAQKKNQAVATITATATVIGDVELTVMKDLEFEVGTVSPTELFVDPQRDAHSGEIKISGTPKSLVRVTNEKQAVLIHENGQSQLFFTYSISGNSSEIQQQSALLTQNNQVKLSENGTYYFWIGGRLSGLENIIPGNYSMELKIDVEYIL